MKLIRSVIAFSLFMLTISFLAFILDLAAPTNKFLKPLRSFAIFNITAGTCDSLRYTLCIKLLLSSSVLDMYSFTWMNVFAALVLFCVLVTGFAYWISEYLELVTQETKLRRTSKTDVQFSVSFYLMTAAGVMSLFASLCNLIKTEVYTPEQQEQQHDLATWSRDQFEHLPVRMEPPQVDISTAEPPPYAP